MIQINDNDTAINVAEKIINGTKPYDPPELIKTMHRVFSGNNEEESIMKMFTVEDVKEIADYLMVYYKSHNEMEEEYENCD